MPTFVFIKNRQTIETIKGANPAAIEAAIRKHAGAPQRDYIEAGSAPADKALQGHVSLSRGRSLPMELKWFPLFSQTSLMNQVDSSQTTCLNESSSHSLKDLLSSSGSDYLESDADEQLLLSLYFLQSVKVFALRFTTKEDELGKAPKTVRIFNDASGLGFDEAAGNDPAMEVVLTKEQASGKELVLTRFVKFQKANSIAVSRYHQARHDRRRGWLTCRSPRCSSLIIKKQAM